MQDGLRQSHALPVALRELSNDLGLDVADGAAVADLVDALGNVGAGEALQPADEGEVFADLHVGVKGRSFRKIADALLHFEGLFQDVETGHVGRTRRGRQEAGEDAHRGGLPGAVRTEKTNDLAFFHLEGDVIDGDRTSVSLRQTFDFNHSESRPKTADLPNKGHQEMPD